MVINLTKQDTLYVPTYVQYKSDMILCETSELKHIGRVFQVQISKDDVKSSSGYFILAFKLFILIFKRTLKHLICIG